VAVDVITLGIVCADVMVRPIDSFPERGKLTIVPQLELHLGGLAGVTATVLSQLGAKTAFFGQVGADGFGHYALRFMRSQGVDVGYVRSARDCGTSATVVLINEDGERTFLHRLGTNALTSERDIDFGLVQEAKVLHWGGPSVNPGLDVEPIGRVFSKAHGMGVKTSMDTCFDGKGIWFPHIEHALPNLDIAMSSIEEARHYTGKDTPEEIANFYCSFGVETVMVKLGAEGMFVKNASEAHHIRGHKVPVVDTTGAGDAACAGFLYGCVQGWDLLACGRLANAVGALTVQHMGGAEAIRSLADVQAFMEKQGQ